MVGISELSKEVSKKTGQTQKVAREVIKVFLDEVVSEANKKQKINLAGFGAILTQNTAWNNVMLAMDNLSKAKLDSIDAIASLPVEEIKKYIKPAGFFNQKSVYLKEICTQIRKEGGISKLEKMSDKDIEAFLIKIKGVGKETMQDIMLYAFKRKLSR